jgi:hypothetical protein
MPTSYVLAVAALKLGLSLDDGKSFQPSADGYQAVGREFDVRAEMSEDYTATVGDGAQPFTTVLTT